METATTTTPKQITIDEIQAHSADGDLWIIVEGKVYDVSKYMSSHPGGAEVLLENANGKDATQAYLDADHTRRARQMLTKYYIGDVA